MLTYLHVRDFALIKELEIEFPKGLSVLTGETGAGKSIIIGSMNAISGNKLDKSIIRRGADYALVEMIFELDTELVHELNLDYGIAVNEDHTLVVSRKYNQSGRSIFRINNETVTAAVMSKVFELAIDIHSQHEHQSLLKANHHIKLVDQYLGNDIEDLKRQLKENYGQYKVYLKEINQEQLDDDIRLREIDFLKFEIEEIEAANLVCGEDITLQSDFKRLSNGKKIEDALKTVDYVLKSNIESNVEEMMGQVLVELDRVRHLDDTLEAICVEGEAAESIIREFSKSIEYYLNQSDQDLLNLDEMTDRIHVINTLKQKFGNTIEDVLATCERKKKKLEDLRHYEENIERIREEIQVIEKVILNQCEALSQKRNQAGRAIAKEIEDVLESLNFANSQVKVQVKQLEKFTQNGFDQVTFLISTNKNEPLQPLNKIASGGELSRVMLAIKSVFAEMDDIGTLVFDEIDSGISGRTAQMVAEKMAFLSNNRQIICITHLPQIAAMADTHYLIKKIEMDERVVTEIDKLNDSEVHNELARLIGGATITDSTLLAAKEMKELGSKTKLK